VTFVGCTGGASYAPDTGGEDLVRISARLESIQVENLRLGGKLDRLEGLLKARPGAKAAKVVAKPASARAGSKPVSKVLKPDLKADEFTVKVQRALKAADYNPGPTDGKKGRRTTAALRSFQRDNNLPETGMADEGTWVLLKRHLD
jgi:peptidoglycan hydrolase-like protein with peptidoglycan-binding domain